MSNTHAPYKSRKNRKRALGSNQRRQASSAASTPPPDRAVNPFFSAVARMLSHQRGD